MTNEKLKRVLDNVNLSDCEIIREDHIYYINLNLKMRVYRNGGGYRYNTQPYEFLIIANKGVKQGIILRHGTRDLHWFVKKQWRGHHVLSNALRTGVIKKVWPEIKTVSCCLEYGEDPKAKFEQTKHLAKLAGVQITTEDTAVYYW